MPFQKVLRVCGHKETVLLMDGETNNPHSIKAHQDQLCYKCYKKEYPGHEVKMDYKTYKIEFGLCRTKPNSYDKDTTKIVVYVPYDHPLNPDRDEI